MTWLMTKSAIEEIEALRVTGRSMAAAVASSVAHAPREMKMLSGPVAVISVKGPLLNEPDGFLDYFGVDYTLYSDIRSQTNEAVGKKSKRIDYEIETNGGELAGLYETMDTIRNVPVKTRTIAGEVIASGGYMLASQTDSIEARNELSLLGSVGVASDNYVFQNLKSVTNRDSPKKRPNLDTEEGVAVVEDTLDDIYQVIAEKIAEGRGVSVETVKNDYGQGAVMTARTALNKKMIDSIQKNQPIATSGAVDSKGAKMNLDELKTEHPAVYRAAFAEGAADGTGKERDRVLAHMVMGKASGDLEASHKAIEDGDEPTAATQAHHTAVGIKKHAMELRAAEAPASLGANTLPEAISEEETKREFEAAHPGWEVS